MIAGGLLVVVLFFAALFVLLVLAGIASAWLEARAERRSGVPVTRPAWDARAHRAATGGRFATVRGYWKGLRS